MALWKSASPFQMRADTLFPVEDLGQVTPSLPVSSLIREGWQSLALSVRHLFHPAPQASSPSPLTVNPVLFPKWCLNPSFPSFCSSTPVVRDFKSIPWLEIDTQLVSLPRVLCPSNLSSNSVAGRTHQNLTAASENPPVALPAWGTVLPGWRGRPSLTWSHPLPPGHLLTRHLALQRSQFLPHAMLFALNFLPSPGVLFAPSFPWEPRISCGLGPTTPGTFSLSLVPLPWFPH